jgi:hypothetical protein
MSAQTDAIRIEPTTPIIPTKQAARILQDQHVEVLVMSYSDRILINVLSEGKIGHMVRIHTF